MRFRFGVPYLAVDSIIIVWLLIRAYNQYDIYKKVGYI